MRMLTRAKDLRLEERDGNGLDDEGWHCCASMGK